MSEIVTQILDDIVDTLRSSGIFEEVKLGKNNSSTAIPRANVLFEGCETFQPDDNDSSQWKRLKARVIIHTRCDSSSQAAQRAANLSDSAAEALLATSYRSAKCHDLPIGKATEIGQSELSSNIKRPEVEISFSLRCHFEIQEA